MNITEIRKNFIPSLVPKQQLLYELTQPNLSNWSHIVEFARKLVEEENFPIEITKDFISAQRVRRKLIFSNFLVVHYTDIGKIGVSTAWCKYRECETNIVFFDTIEKAEMFADLLTIFEVKDYDYDGCKKFCTLAPDEIYCKKTITL